MEEKKKEWLKIGTFTRWMNYISWSKQFSKQGQIALHPPKTARWIEGIDICKLQVFYYVCAECTEVVSTHHLVPSRQMTM